jgi:hypothetical protein
LVEAGSEEHTLVSLIKLITTGRGFEFTHDAPIIEDVVLFHTKPGKPQKRLLALIDTGTDGTAIPKGLVKDLQLERTGRGSFHSTLDEKGNQIVKLRLFYRLKMEICGRPHTTEYAFAGMDEFIRLGRDVLVRCKLNICWIGDTSQKGGTLEIADSK